MVLVPEQPAARQWSWAIPVAIGVLAFLMRLMSAMHSGGLDALFGYDEGVYFGASTSWVSGLMPYRDFALVHPPGSVALAFISEWRIPEPALIRCASPGLITSSVPMLS